MRQSIVKNHEQGRGEEKVNREKRTLSPLSFFDANGDEVVGVVPHWKVYCPFSSALQIEESENSLIIGIDDDAYIDEEFKIELSDLDGNYSSTLLIRIESLL